jgi:hypothetical protein
MSDVLVRALNGLGYQPVFLPRTGLEPPEIYHLSKKGLVRHGPLADCLPPGTSFKHTTGALGDIEYKYTSAKSHSGACTFLGNALRCIGISSIPKIDLSFSGTNELSFAFSGVTYDSVDPTKIGPLLVDFRAAAIPMDYVESGLLHIAYEYAFAKSVLLSRSDNREFAEDISGRVGEFIDLGTRGKVRVESRTTLSFAGAGGDVAAFAYKAGRLEKTGERWTFRPEDVQRGAPAGSERPWLAAPGVVLSVD